VLLKESRAQLGLPEPEVNPLNLFGAEGEDPKPSGLRDLLAPLFRSPAFWIVCALSLGTTLVRETFNTWTPTYFNQVVGYSKAEAAGMSAVFRYSAAFPCSFPVSGAIAWAHRPLGDHVLQPAAKFCRAIRAGLAARGRRARTADISGGVGRLPGDRTICLPGGAIALDFGGKHGSATSSGIIDGVGYLAVSSRATPWRAFR